MLNYLTENAELIYLTENIKLIHLTENAELIHLTENAEWIHQTKLFSGILLACFMMRIVDAHYCRRQMLHRTKPSSVNPPWWFMHKQHCCMSCRHIWRVLIVIDCICSHSWSTAASRFLTSLFHWSRIWTVRPTSTCHTLCPTWTPQPITNQ